MAKIRAESCEIRADWELEKWRRIFRKLTQVSLSFSWVLYSVFTIFDESSYLRSLHWHRSSWGYPARLPVRSIWKWKVPWVHFGSTLYSSCSLYADRVGSKFAHHWPSTRYDRGHTCNSSLGQVWGAQMQSILGIEPCFTKDSPIMFQITISLCNSGCNSRRRVPLWGWGPCISWGR